MRLIMEIIDETISLIYDKRVSIIPSGALYRQAIAKVLAKKALEGKSSIAVSSDFFSALNIIEYVKDIPEISNWICEKRQGYLRFITEATIYCKSINNILSLLGRDSQVLYLEIIKSKDLELWYDAAKRIRPGEQIIISSNINCSLFRFDELEACIHG